MFMNAVNYELTVLGYLCGLFIGVKSMIIYIYLDLKILLYKMLLNNLIVTYYTDIT